MSVLYNDVQKGKSINSQECIGSFKIDVCHYQEIYD